MAESYYRDIIEKNIKQLKADGQTEESILRMKKKKPLLHFRDSKKLQRPKSDS